MEGGVHRGRWNIKAKVGKSLLLMFIFVHTSTQSQEQKCQQGDILTDKGICCPKCYAGYKLVDECLVPGQRSNCTPCPDGQFMDQMNYETKCRSCRKCKEQWNEEEESPCARDKNTICRCKVNYYQEKVDTVTFNCRKCTPCRPDEKEIKKCTQEHNTVCECNEKYHKVKGKCEPCKNCTTDCNHLCSPHTTLNTKAPGPHNGLTNMICGVVSVTVVLLVLVVIITYCVTKSSTKKKLLKLSTQSSDTSVDSCEQVLIEEPPNSIGDKAVPSSPVIEQEQPSNLPDCVPLEIRISDLIYTVLDLVPVPRRKELARSLGVRDTEIEQAELDYRSCREAHYQMLRVWAERGSRAGGMLHQPLLQELLDELRKMHLGQAAEELETKYGIQ